MKFEIEMRFSLYGVHYYPGMPKLGVRHPHEFGITIKIPINKPREIEWIEFRDNIIKDIKNSFPATFRPDGKFLDFGSLSCEEIAVEVAKMVSKQYVRAIIVSVDEIDEQCGANVYFSEEEMKNFAKEPEKEGYIS